MLYDIWINAIGREDLREKPMERVRKSYRICTIHFGPEARYVGTRYKSTIKADAIPSLFLSTAHRKEVYSTEVKIPEQIASTETESFNNEMLSTSQTICEEVLPYPSSSITPAKISRLEVHMDASTAEFDHIIENIKEENSFDDKKQTILATLGNITSIIINDIHSDDELEAVQKLLRPIQATLAEMSKSK